MRNSEAKSFQEHSNFVAKICFFHVIQKLKTIPQENRIEDKTLRKIGYEQFGMFLCN